MNRSSRNVLWLMIVVVLAACWLGSQRLNADPVWEDEYASMRDAGLLDAAPGPITEIWSRVGEGNPWHTPGFFILLNLWSRLVGRDPALLRAFALFAGLLAIAWTYRLGRVTLSSKTGLYASAIVASSVFFVYYLHELRMYTLLVLWTAVTLWAYFCLIKPNAAAQAPASRFALFLGGIGLLYTHYFGALPLLLIGTYHLFFVRKNRHWWMTTATLAAAVALFLPWLAVLVEALGRARGATELHERALQPVETIAQFGYLFSNGAIVFLIGLLLISVWAAFRVHAVRRITLFAAALLMALLLTNAMLQIMHSGRLRYLIILFPLVALVVATGIIQLRRLAPLVLIAWVAVGMLNVQDSRLGDIDGARPRFPTHHVRQAIANAALPNDVVVSFVGNRSFRIEDAASLYFGMLPVDYVMVEGRDAIAAADLNGESDVSALDQVWSEERVWLATVPGGRVPRDATIAPLLENYARCSVATETVELQVTLFALDEVCCSSPNTAPRFSFGNAIRLVNVSVPEEAAGDLPVGLFWSIDTESITPTIYSVGLQVFDAEGAKRLQADYGLEAQAVGCYRNLLDISSLRPGTYEVRATVYAWQSDERLLGMDLSTGMTAELLPIGTFTVS